MVYREFQPMGGEMSRRYPTAGYRCWRRGAVFFFSPPFSSRVVHLVVELCGRAAVRGGRLPADGRREAAAAVLVVVGQRQVEQAGAGGQVDVLHVLHL